MNTITGFTFYDSLNKLTVGTLLLLLAGGMIGEKAETNILFFVTAFIIGIFYQTFIKDRTRFLTNNLHMIKKAHENVILKNKYITKDDYLEAYYNVVKNGFLMNIPTLEAHENFLRNIWLICLMYLIAVLADCCQSSISEIICQYSKCAIAMFLLLLIVFIPFVWYKIQMKIFELVWEGDYYAKRLNPKNRIRVYP
ncbi:hypothetical protein [Prevotella pectinovora]|uniref:hypothetical protein n=1 Tax=Prevotella pectinovora TaxID=1602169 RepID=UPI00307A45C1